MVSATVVIVMGEEGEDKYLVAYVVKEKPCDKKEIRELLKLRLPFYMVPSYFVFLDRSRLVFYVNLAHVWLCLPALCTLSMDGSTIDYFLLPWVQFFI